MTAQLDNARDRVAALMPELTADLARLVAIPSVSATNYPPETHAELIAARDAVVELLEGAGVENVRSLELPDTAPVVLGEIPAPEGAPTVLLYGHYDVVPAGDEAKWDSPPFELTERDGALFGRGSADTKSNILAHIGALRAWDGRPPVGIKIVIEGQEEVGSALNDYPATHPALFQADAMVIADMGSVRPGVPTLTIGLRGMAQTTMEVETLAGPKHSGQYGGAAPDALGVLLQALATLHDENGDVAVEGLQREPWTGAGVHRGRVPRARGGEGRPPARRLGRSRLARLVGPVDHRHRDRHRLRRRRAQRGQRALPGEDQHPRAPGAGRRRGPGGRRPPPREPAPVRDRPDRPSRRDRQRVPRRDVGPRLRGRARGDAGRVGHRGLVRRDRGLDPARQRAPPGRAARPRSCSSARPTATRTSTRRTSAC